MAADREQIRRDLDKLRVNGLGQMAARFEAELEQAEWKLENARTVVIPEYERQLEQAERELSSTNRELDEVVTALKQVERERDEERHAKNSAMILANNALAKVPALVEALRYCARRGAADRGTALKALATWEQE